MQEGVVDQGEAERAEPSWYLTRDGKQVGPLTDRELSLFAEGGNFKDGDLLWTAGLDSWKPANAVFGLASSPEADRDEAVEANGESTGAPVFVDASPEDDAGLTFEPDGNGDASFTIEPNGKAADAEFILRTTIGALPNRRQRNTRTATPPTPSSALLHDDSAHAVTEPNGEDVDALVQALTRKGGETQADAQREGDRGGQEVRRDLCLSLGGFHRAPRA